MERKGWLLGATVVALLLAMTCSVNAQITTPEDMGLNYSITAGAAFPITSSLKNNSAVIIGIDWYGLAPSSTVGENTAFGLTVDWIPISRNNGANADLVPMLLNFRKYGNLAGYRIFTTLGVGVLATSDNIPEMKLDNGANFGWTAGAGIDLTNRAYVEAKFIGGKDPSTDGLACVQLGYRF